jgi:4-amino-4-deoxy-L-arabinose transferase-like glycosyltransferase
LILKVKMMRGITLNKNLIALVGILLISLFLRLPFVYEASPYFHREDEAHHFNRTINMLKSGNLDPDYFHKPSLHFYLRLPVAAAGFLVSVKKSEIKEVQELITTDPFGIADYAFSASHPRVLHISRAFSLALSLSSIALVYLICLQLKLGSLAALGASLLFGLSPSAIEESAVIGVDNLMMFFCLWTVYLALRALNLKTNLALFWCAAAAGLALSSKYNALPIILIPILVLISNKSFRLEACLIAVFVAPIFFILGSPYILLNIPKFLNQFAYEIWHYGVAGHAGHMAEPGLEQLKFYISWLGSEAIGVFALALSLYGMTRLAKQSQALIAFCFPVMFFILMVFQKANFERNMLVIIPFVCILSAAALNSSRILKVLFALCLIQPAYSAINLSFQTYNISESRLLLKSPLEDISRAQSATAADGDLQLDRSILNLAGVERIDISKNSSANLFQLGFDKVLLSCRTFEQTQLTDFYTVKHKIEGAHEKQRIVTNPCIYILEAKKVSEQQIMDLDASPIAVDLNTEAFSREGHFWIKDRISKLDFSAYSPRKSLKIRVFSPWKEQNITVLSAGQSFNLSFNEAQENIFELPLIEGQSPIFISSKVHSPKSLGISKDDRRLSFAIKEIL